MVMERNLTELAEFDPLPDKLRRRFQAWVDTLLSEADMAAAFRVSRLTIFAWRQGKGLPYIRIPAGGNDSIRYELPSVIKWAKENGKRVYLTKDAQ